MLRRAEDYLDILNDKVKYATNHPLISSDDKYAIIYEYDEIIKYKDLLLELIKVNKLESEIEK